MPVASTIGDPLAKTPPLRLPGEHLSEQIDDLFNEKLTMGFALMEAMFAMAWWRYWFHMPLTPWFFTFMAVAVIAVTDWRWRKFRKRVQRRKYALLSLFCPRHLSPPPFISVCDTIELSAYF